MVLIRTSPDTLEKLFLLSNDSRYDLACACATRPDEHRRRSRDHTWIYPVSLPQGGTTYLFKTLLSNICVNDCAYCPLRSRADARRCCLTPEELSKAFLEYYRQGRVSGLFLSSGVTRSPEETMEKINRTALILRRSQFKGYIHLKIIPGASDAAIAESLSLANAVSLNIETPGEENFRKLGRSKDYRADILRPLKLISSLTRPGARFSGRKHTTQFVVGASTETDSQIIGYSWKLYKDLGLNRVYFSAYQRGGGSPDLPGERSALTNAELLIREHRLYQVDWLLRKYGFRADEIPLDDRGNLPLELDPKELWARRHPDFFPVDLNRDEKWRLLRVPGLGAVAAERILALRGAGGRVRLEKLGLASRLCRKAAAYVR